MTPAATTRTGHRRSVTVVIPAYNAERYLAAAIGSVLAQGYAPIELLVIDDGSTDRTAAVAAGFSGAVRYERIPHSGAGAARNRGVAIAGGELLAFLDADDVWTPDKLARQVRTLETEPELEAVFGHVRQFRSPDLSAEEAARIRISAEVLPGYVPGTMLIRRTAFVRVGYFETVWRVGEFVSWHSRASECRLRTAMLPDVLMHRRLHAGNLGRRERQARSEYLRLLKATLDRRRAGAVEPGGAHG